MGLALVLFAPARWLAAFVDQASQGHVVLEDPRGTVWTGSTQWALAGGRGSRDAVALPSRLAWTLRPGLRGLVLSLHTACCTPEPVTLDLQPTWQGLAVRVADVAATHWPAQLLAGLGTPWNTLQLEGRLQLSTRGLQLQWTPGQMKLQGHAELLALDMASQLSTLRPLGSYRLTLEGGAAVALRLDTLQGGLRLAGTGQWDAPHLRFSGIATAEPDHAAVLANLLNLLGRRDGARSIISLG
jgi:general secretion pathway protein N